VGAVKYVVHVWISVCVIGNDKLTDIGQLLLLYV